ncbi:hypothetical protein [Bacillus toyonensis]|uniref:hypothetical protein n=1 Tax=Bacillus toyonensis TaxID=155322 RepID=UPI002E22CED7|nr:hypothetical protein [Bacillus toyonensis]
MAGLMKRISNYGILLDSLELSPFETLNALDLRSDLQKEVINMTNQEQLKLHQYDLYLLNHIDEIKNHLENVYDFKDSIEPFEQCWWHLDKIFSKEIIIKPILFVETNAAP